MITAARPFMRNDYNSTTILTSHPILFPNPILYPTLFPLFITLLTIHRKSDPSQSGK